MDVSGAQNSSGTPPRVVGRPFMPGGRATPAAGRSRSQRPPELVGEDGMKLAVFWFSIMQDETRRDRDRLEASRLLADRGWGKAPAYAAIEEADSLDLASLEQAAEEFRKMVLRLAPDQD